MLAQLVIILIIVVFAYFALTSLTDVVDDTKTKVATAEDLKKQDIKAEANQKICDLKVTVYGEIFVDFGLFDETPFVDHFNIHLGEGTSHPNAIKAEWIEGSCYTGTNAYSWFPAFYLERLQQEAFVNYVAGDLHLQLQFNSVDSTQFRTFATDPSLEKLIHIPVGTFTEPLLFVKTFLVEDLPREKYKVEIVIEDQKINDRPANTAYEVFVNP